jgi:hypothetical protein
MLTRVCGCFLLVIAGCGSPRDGKDNIHTFFMSHIDHKNLKTLGLYNF